MTGYTTLSRSSLSHNLMKNIMRPITHWEASLINSAIPPLLIAHGLHHHGMDWLYLQLVTWSQLLAGVFLSSVAMQWLGCRYGARLQPDKPHALVDFDDAKARRLLIEESLETARCMFVISCMAAWPLLAFQKGEPTGLTMRLEDTGGSLGRYLLSFIVGFPVADLWLYTKHRLLHTKYLWAFHAHHHAFHNPSAFGGFAVCPLESLWTFAPILLWNYLPHFIPIFGPAVGIFVMLNTYLHCGFSFAWAERLLPALLLNSSCFHNVHHELATTHFGEISSFWDYALGTSAIYDHGLRSGYNWHLEKHRLRSAASGAERR